MRIGYAASLFFMLAAWPLPHGFAQDPNLLRVNSPEYTARADKLRASASKQYDFSKATLGDVIRFLATDAGISFFSLPDGNPEADRLITFSLNSSPFQALETLCKANGLALVIDGGIWYVRPADDKELIGKAYEIKHNSLERITKVNASDSGSGGASSSSSSGSSSSGSGGSDALQAGNVDLQGTRETFRTEKSELINDIRAILDLAAEQADGTSASDNAATMASSAASSAIAANAPTDIYGNIRKPKVLWKSDSNTLYIVATRLQHMWVEGYLTAADKPQSLIAIEVKFFETSRDPSREFGLDWSGTLGQTGTFRRANELEVGADGTTTLTQDILPQSEGGFRADLSHLAQVGDALDLKSFGVSPLVSVLTAQDLNVKLRAMLTDQETKTVSYPRMVTTNNREVAIRAVVNQPVLGGSASSSLGAGSTTTSAISYLPIGTVINILPKRMERDKVNLNVAITVSSIIGTETIQGNPYPIASSRVYSAPVEIPSGYTVAVGGLDEAKEKKSDTGVPVLNKIPVLGWAFKSRSRSKNHKNLMIFITPTIIDPKDGGLSDEPQGVLPRKPAELMPKVPRLAESGGLIGGIEALPNAVAFLKRSGDEIKQVIEENRGTKAEAEKLNELITAVERTEQEVKGYLSAYPERWDELNKYQWQLGKIIDQAQRSRTLLRKKAYY